MTYEAIKSMIDELEIPSAYYEFEDGSDIEPPFVCFYYPNSDNFSADNKVYGKIDELIIELYTDEKNFELEKKLEDILNEHEISYEKDETYIKSEMMYMVVYDTEVVING